MITHGNSYLSMNNATDSITICLSSGDEISHPYMLIRTVILSRNKSSLSLMFHGAGEYIIRGNIEALREIQSSILTKRISHIKETDQITIQTP
jgi:hypothetical protein